MTSNDIFLERTDEKEIQSFIKKLHNAYNNRIVNYYEIKEADLSRFMWSENKYVSLYMLCVFSDNKFYPESYIFFAIENSDHDQFFYADLVNETSNYTFGNISEASINERLSWLVKQKILSPKFIKKINSQSLIFSFAGLDDTDRWAKKWVDAEYEATNKDLSKNNVIESFPLSNQKVFVDRYHFDEMLNTLDDNQFKDEFDQCLFAYNSQKWFICAAGLGSCLEHLMEKIIINYDKKGYRLLKRLGKNPTAKDYLSIFRKDPINLEPRQETYINMLFMARNSVDHHNTGYTKKNICDSLLDGIKNIFNDYYSSSILAKDVPKDD